MPGAAPPLLAALPPLAPPPPVPSGLPRAYIPRASAAQAAQAAPPPRPRLVTMAPAPPFGSVVQPPPHNGRAKRGRYSK